MKPDNFLFEEKDKYDLKLIDFGLSRSYSEEKRLTTLVGTPFYVAPDVLTGNYDERCDYWSAGAMFFVMLSGEPPFVGNNNSIIFEKIKACKYSFSKSIWNTVSDDAKDLIGRFLIVDPNKRLTARDALNDKWFNPIETEYLETGKQLICKKLINRLKNFRTTSRFQKEVIKIMVSLNDDLKEVQELRYVFFFLDYLNNGVITGAELRSFFAEVGEEISEHELNELVDSLYLRHQGVISYTEFVAATIERSFFFEDANLKIAFQRFDVDNTGYITQVNIKECLARFGYKISEADVLEMISDFDIKQDGKIAYDEFIMMMKSEGTDKRIKLDSKLSGRHSGLQGNGNGKGTSFNHGGESFTVTGQETPVPMQMMHNDHIHVESEMDIRKKIAMENEQNIQ